MYVRPFLLLSLLQLTSGGNDIGMNLLSGVTWKGAKLRIGEAKPDFKERCVQVVFVSIVSVLIPPR